MKENMKKMITEHGQVQRELQYTIEALENDKLEITRKFEEKLQQFEQQRSSYIEDERKKNEEKIQQIQEKEKDIQNELREEIRILKEESNKRTDEFLKQGVNMDQLKDEITILKESEVKLKNNNDCLKEMNNIMQNILKKHEDDNKKLAEQLYAFKQQIIDSDSFSKENKKYVGWRHATFGKSQALLYFTEENVGDFKTDNEYYIVMEFGSGNAVKVALNKLEEFYMIEGTNQLCFRWPDKNKLFKSKRTETFESDSSEEILVKYLEIIEKRKEKCSFFN